MKISTVTQIDLTMAEARKSLTAYNVDMMIELADVFFGIDRAELNRTGVRVRKFNVREMAEFAVEVSNPVKRAELANKAGIAVVDTPDRFDDWCKLIEEMPMLFFPTDVLDGLSDGGPVVVKVFLDGYALNVDAILRNY